MSGGSFQYAYSRVRDFADELGDKLAESPEPPEIAALLQGIRAEAVRFAEIMRAVEWYYSSDIGEDTLIERVAEVRKGGA